MNTIKNIDYRLTPHETIIVICYQNQHDEDVVLMPKYNDVYEFASQNAYLEWIQSDIVEGEFLHKYHSVTFDELLEDENLSVSLFKDYINAGKNKKTCKCSKPCE